MLLVLTPNPAIDRLLVVPGFRNAEVVRVLERRDAAGGKGLNVARVARTLGQDVRVLGLLGGETGRRVAALAAREGFDAHWAWMQQGETRICTLISDPERYDTLTINEPGPHLAPADWDALENLVYAEAAQAQGLCIAGSLMPATQLERFQTMLSSLPAHCQIFLDTSGPALGSALGLPLKLIKVNADEIGDVLNSPIHTLEEAAQAAHHVCAMGTHIVVITLGKRGAVAASSAGSWAASPPEISSLSPVGSGDATMAGLASAILQGQSLPEALRLGVACGTANALTIGPGSIRNDDLQQMLHVVQITQLS